MNLLRFIAKCLPTHAYEFALRQRSKLNRKNPPIKQLIAYVNTHHVDLNLSILDIGARFGIESSGLGPLCELDRLQLVGIEPDPAEANRLRNPLKGRAYETVYTTAVWDKKTSAELYVTECVGCTSKLEPDMEALREYRIGHWFKPIKKIVIDYNRLDSVVETQSIFDIIKIDVQGGEWNVIQGGPELFSKCSAIILEAHFIPIYKGQKTIDEILQILRPMGFRLIKIETGGEAFDGEIVEANCIFVKETEKIHTKNELLKQLLVATLFGNFEYCEKILRNCGTQFLTQTEFSQIASLLGVSIRKPRPIDSWNLAEYDK
jgi:FkbM family methyltransferase